jgi:hypothetical protein
MAKQKEKRAIDIIVTQPDIQIPWEVARFMDSKTIRFFGDQICLSNEGDYATLAEARKAIEWYVDQLGGKVKW